MLPEFVLASTSPRRVDLLRGIGLSPTIVAPCVGEDERPLETPEGHAGRLAEEKARAVAARLPVAGREALVLGADTVVTLDGAILGKPRDEGDALRMLRFLSGRGHEVLTGVFLLRSGDGRSAGLVDRTRVWFRPLEERLLRWYVATGEPDDKAGAYSIQGLGGLLAERIEGSWTNVVGLPVESLSGLFRRVGVDLLDLVTGDGGDFPRRGDLPGDRHGGTS